MPRTRRIQGSDGREHEAEPVGFRASGEHFNEYLLDDGTVLRIKLVLTEVLRMSGLYDRYGNPAYIVRSSEVMAVDAPDHLMEGGDASG
jgi:hypothetical protein